MVGASTDKKAPPHPAVQNQQEAGPVVHDDGVVQGFTDGYIVVKGHHCHQDKFHCPQEKIEVCLGDAASKRYIFFSLLGGRLAALG